ncbi:hypothetical protein DXG01_011777 [Tephrocybe rancida]|nr:hypothetical protein DXG01_011777 [Tephrocybe rancida]
MPSFLNSILNSPRSKLSRPPKSVPPWEDWELDAAFLSALNEWNIKNPESNLERVLGTASVAIDQAKDIMDVIPDSPFPARSLVRALLQLVKLGATLSSAKLKLSEFAMEIIGWVDIVKSSFVAAGIGEFTNTTWENLAKIREVIDEICNWATFRLIDGRWSLSNFKIDNEIADFKARLNDARKVFQDRSVIGLSSGLDTALRKLAVALGYQDRISRILRKIRKTQDDHYARIMDELQGQKESHARRQFLQTFLYPKTAQSTAYDQQEKLPCDEGTRKEVLAEIREWINDVSNSSRNFLWLTGDPGCGKSAVTASVARECKDRKVLWAQFFINRNIVETTNPNLYFPSIARQLADYSELVERQIHATLRHQPSLMDRISSAQATKLFVDTLGAAASINSKTSVVVVIDGLDETDQKYLEDTATIFSHLFDALAKHPNAKIFISSRTEDGIQRPFSKTKQDRRVKNIHLDTSSKSSIRDVTSYLCRRLSQLSLKHGLDPRVWPGDDRLATLASHASGHFIWAVTVSNFLQEQMDEWGHECLDTVMDNMGTTEGKQDIKALYSLILHMTYQKSKDPWAFETFRRVVGAIATAVEPFSIAQLGDLLKLQRDSLSAPVDLFHFVRRLRTVLVSGSANITDATVLRLHKSFFEYITSENSETRFRVILQDSHAELMLQCLRQLVEFYTHAHDIALQSKPKPLSPVLLYALKFCHSHLPQQMGVASFNVVIDDPAMPRPLQLNSMFQQSSNMCYAGPLTLRYPKNTKRVITSLDYSAILWNAVDGLPESDFSTADGHNDEISCLATSFNGTHIASGSCDGSVRVWNAFTLQPVSTHTVQEKVFALSFSPDGDQLAVSGGALMSIHIIYLWTDAIVDKLSGESLEQSAVVFSPDGTLHVVGASQQSCTVIVGLQYGNLQYGSPVKRTQMQHSARVDDVVVSRDCTRILSITEKHLCIWDLQNGVLLQTLISSMVYSASLSPDKDTVVYSSSRMIRVRNPARLTRFNLSLQYLHSTGIEYVNFSPSGKSILTCSLDAAHLWENGFRSSMPLGAVNIMCWPVFSPREDYLVLSDSPRVRRIRLSPQTSNLTAEWTSFSRDGNLHIVAYAEEGLLLYKPATDTPVGVRLPFTEGGSVRMRYAAFSPDASRIAGISNEGKVYVWDADKYKLLGASTQSIPSASLVAFAPDGSIVITSATQRATHLVLDGESLHTLELPKQSTAPTHYFELDTPGHICRTQNIPNRRLETVRWYAGPSTDSGVFWAFIDNHLIRGGADGSFVVVPADIVAAASAIPDSRGNHVPIGSQKRCQKRCCNYEYRV